MKRIAVLAVYDSEGILYEYLEYYIQSLSEVVSKLIIVVIGTLKEESLKRLKQYSAEIYAKENSGYDAAAYKFVLEKYLDAERLNQYDELILTNDTCFGPFVSFKNIFEDMDKRNIDFWGLKYIEDNCLNHLQSNFRVFRKSIFQDIRQYFRKEICDNDDRESVVAKFEMRLFNVLTKKGFKYGYYGIAKGYWNYRAPDYCIREEKYPLMKKRCFEKKRYSYENCIGALLYIRNNTSYDINMILDYIKIKYQLEYDINREFEKFKASPQYFIEKSICRQEDIRLFCENNSEIYIYGAGKLATAVYEYYREYLGNMQGFIISDNQVFHEEHLGIKIFKISEIKNRQVGIILGVSKAATEEIRPNLFEYKNVLYLW